MGSTPFSGGSSANTSSRDAEHRATVERMRSETRAYERQTSFAPGRLPGAVKA